MKKFATLYQTQIMGIDSRQEETTLLSRKFRQFKLDDLVEINRIARRGIRASLFSNFANAVNMPEKTLASLMHIHPRTVSNYKLQNRKLNPVESEHLLKLIALYLKGESVFGSISEFSYWLQKPFWNSKETPFEWLITPGGTEIVLQEINRLEQGYTV